MADSPSALSRAPVSGAADRSMVWLLGQPHLGDYLDFQKNKVIRSGECDLRAHAADWRAANDLYYDLEKCEAGAADTIECRPLDPALADLATEIERHPWFQSSFDDLPYSFELVELDKLVVSQIQVENRYSQQLARRLGRNPSADALFRFCLPLERTLPPHRIERLASNRYRFTSPSSDFREHSPRLVKGDALAALHLADPAIAMLGISVGFGSNFLSGVRSGSRVLLQNGYHRAYALRAAGLTHAWCIVEHVTRKDDLRLTADDSVCSDPEFYFAARRPPMLRDFFDPRIAREFRARSTTYAIEVEINVRTSNAYEA